MMYGLGLVSSMIVFIVEMLLGLKKKRSLRKSFEQVTIKKT